MTVTQLLAYITAALLAQLLIGIGIALWRRRVTVNENTLPDGPDLASVPTGAWRDFRVVQREFEDPARTQCSFYLQPVDGVALVPFRAGQYLTFSLQLRNEIGGGERTITRCYSLSDRPDPSTYRITIKRAGAPSGRPKLPPGVASTYFHDRVRIGDILRVKAPAGHFFLSADSNLPAVFIAGGIGITPMMSMLRWSELEQAGRLLHLYYGVRSRSDHAFKQVLEDLAAMNPSFRLQVIYSRPDAGDAVGRDYQHPGHIDLDLLRRTLPQGRHQFYVCGPPAMMQSLVPALRSWGVHAEDILFEAFGPASGRPAGVSGQEPKVAAPALMAIQFRRSGRTLSWDGTDANLLDFAERHDLLPDSGCRTGSCGACETRLVSGTVDYADPPDHDVADGCCLLCIGRPRTALVLEA